MTRRDYTAIVNAVRALGRMNWASTQQYESIRSVFGYYLQETRLDSGEEFDIYRYREITDYPNDSRGY